MKSIPSLPLVRGVALSGITAAVFSLSVIASRAGDPEWPSWRGPTSSGHAKQDERADTPARFDPAEGTRWKIALEGWGDSTPVAADGRIFFTSQVGRTGASPNYKGPPPRLSVEARDLADGALLWRDEFGPASVARTHAKNNLATASCATDGIHVFSLFGSGDLMCHTVTGELLWRRDLTADYGTLNLLHGHGASPVLAGGRLIVAFGHTPTPFSDEPTAEDKAFARAYYLLGVDPETGENIYEVKRSLPENARNAFGTPIVIRTEGPDAHDELVLGAHGIVYAHDPTTGRELWRCRGIGEDVIPSPVRDEHHIYVPSTFNGPTITIRPGGSGDVTETHRVWSNAKLNPWIASPILAEGRIYIATNNGVLRCADTGTGEVIWEERLEGEFYASPVLAGGLIHFITEDGDLIAMRPGDKLEVVARTPLGEPVIASPALAGGSLIVRTKAHLIRIDPARTGN